LAEKHPSFIWRIPDNQVKLQLTNLKFDQCISSAVSIWENIDSLKDYTYNFLHGTYLKRSREWFKKVEGPQLVIWNVVSEAQPSLKESFERLEYLKKNGPSNYAYGWR